MAIFINFLLHFLFTGLYFIGVALIVLFVKYVIKIKGEWYRKILHLFYTGSIFCFLYIFDYWYTSVIAISLFLIIAIIGLTILEKFSFYPELLAERSKGEVKRSLSIAFIIFIVGISVFWGILGPSHKYIVLASILAWGIGDALAALVGKRENSKVIEHKLVTNRKTFDGSIAMFLGATIVIFLVLYFIGEKTMLYSTIVSIIAGAVATIVELSTKDGWDTLTVAPITMTVLIFIETLVSRIFFL